MGSFIYPRTVSIRRPSQQTGVGYQPSEGSEQAGEEQSLFNGLPAGIQARREGQKSAVGLPGDGSRPVWYIFIPRRALPLGSVQDRDIVVDDLGKRYQVLADYWDSMGYRLTVERLEA